MDDHCLPCGGGAVLDGAVDQDPERYSVRACRQQKSRGARQLLRVGSDTVTNMLRTIAFTTLLLFSTHARSQTWSDPVEIGDGYIRDLDFGANGAVYVAEGTEVMVSYDTLATFQDMGLTAVVTDMHYDLVTGTLYVNDWLDGLHSWSETGGWTGPFLEGIHIESVWGSESKIVVGGGAGQLFSSEDAGDSWNTLNVERLHISDNPIGAVTVTSWGKGYWHGWMGLWGPLLFNVGSGYQPVLSDDIRAIRFTDSVVYAALSKDVFMTADGANWETLFTAPVSWSIGDFEISGVIYAVTDASGGVLVSLDGGSSWMDMRIGLYDTNVDFLRIGPDNHLYAVMDNRIQRTVDPLVGVSGAPIDVAPTARLNLGLSAPFPNPASGVVMFEATGDGKTELELTVVDALGRELATVYSGRLPIGQSRFIIKERLASGSYRIVMRSTGIVSSVPFSMVK